MEKLEKARQEWNQKDIERREKMVALRQEKKEADADFEKINKSLRDYEKATTLVYHGKKFTRQPHIWDFLRTVGRNERIHDNIHRSNWIGWRMGWSENYF